MREAAVRREGGREREILFACVCVCECVGDEGEGGKRERCVEVRERKETGVVRGKKT